MSSSKFDYPNINVGGKSNEQNMQSVKAYLTSLSDQLNFYLNNLETRVEVIEAIVNNSEK